MAPTPLGQLTVWSSRLGSLGPATLARLHELTLEGASELRAALDRAFEDDRVWLAERDGRVVGWCLIYRPFRGHERFRKIGVYVDPDHRDQGIGSILVDITIGAVEASPLPVHAVPTTEAGRRFFRRFAHVKTGQPVTAA